MKLKRHLLWSCLIASGILYFNPGCSKEQLVEPVTCLFEFPIDTLIETHSTWTQSHYVERLEDFMLDTINEGEIVMLGNSLTEQGGNWSSKIGARNVRNRGISGDNTDGVMARLGELICARPSVVFVMIGTNDLWTSQRSDMVAEKIE